MFFNSLGNSEQNSGKKSDNSVIEENEKIRKASFTSTQIKRQ